MPPLKVVSLALALFLIVGAASPFGKLGLGATPRTAEAACSDGTFTGSWVNDTVELSVSGDNISGVWTPASRPPFAGVLTDDDCIALITFPDDATYGATLVNPCRIQWSFPDQPDTIDPNNSWTCSGGQVSPGEDEADDADEDENNSRNDRPRPNVGGVFGGVNTAQANRERAGIIYPTPQPAPAPVVRPPSTGDGGLILAGY